MTLAPEPAPETIPKAVADTASGDVRRSFWQRRVLDVVVAQLRQGISPEKIALTIALGASLAVFPIIGSTSLLCAFAAYALRLNQPVIHLVNWLCYPLQFVLLLPFLRAGEWIGAPHLSLSIPQLLARFNAGPLHFVADFATVALGGVAAWLAVVPLSGFVLYLLMLAPLRALQNRKARS